MMRNPKLLALIALITFIAALAGTMVGRSLADIGTEPVNQLHVLLYDELDLTDAQRRNLKLLEADFAKRKAIVERQLGADNAAIANAMEMEHGYGAKVEAAVDRMHGTMGKLQKLTLEHVFAMRQELTPVQARRYDQVVAKLLRNADK